MQDYGLDGDLWKRNTCRNEGRVKRFVTTGSVGFLHQAKSAFWDGRLDKRGSDGIAIS